MNAVAIITASEINREHSLARSSAENAVQHAVRCGELLIAKKAELEHGEFMTWVEANCEFSQATANNYMKASQNPNALGISIRHLFPAGRPTAARMEHTMEEPAANETKPNPRLMKKADKVEYIRKAVEQGFTSRQIADRLGYVGEGYATVNAIAKEAGIPINTSKTRLINAARVIETTVHTLAGARQGIEAIGSGWSIPKDEAAEWADDLAESLRVFKRTLSQLRSIANE